MKNLKFRLIIFSVMISIFLHCSSGYPISFLDKSKKIVKTYKKPLLILGAISLLGILAFYFKNRFFGDDRVVTKGKLYLGSQDFDISDKEHWDWLKTMWLDKTRGSEDERKAILDSLSDEQKAELELEEREEVISIIEQKIYSPDKNISDDEWKVAQDVSRSMPQFKPDVAELLKKTKNEVVIAAKNLDIMKRKLYSKEKNILETAWALSGEMHKTIPTYKPSLGKMLCHKKGMYYVLRSAREIDAEHDRLCENRASFSSREVRKLKQKLIKLPQYKSYLFRAES